MVRAGAPGSVPRGGRRCPHGRGTGQHARPGRVHLAAVGALLLLAGCAASPRAGTVASLALPPGPLASLVPAPSEAPSGLVPLLKVSGPVGLSRVADFSSAAAQTRARLRSHGFQDGYLAEYADVRSGRSLLVLVLRFTTAAGAAADLHDDVGDPLPAGGERLRTPRVGASSAAEEQPLSGGGQLVVIRFRVGRLTYLVGVGAREPVSVPAVVAIASDLAARAAGSTWAR